MRRRRWRWRNRRSGKRRSRSRKRRSYSRLQLVDLLGGVPGTEQQEKVRSTLEQSVCRSPPAL